MKYKITKAIAIGMVEMEAGCYNEGIGGFYGTELIGFLLAIGREYPELKEEYSYLPVFTENKL